MFSASLCFIDLLLSDVQRHGSGGIWDGAAVRTEPPHFSGINFRFHVLIKPGCPEQAVVSHLRFLFDPLRAGTWQGRPGQPHGGHPGRCLAPRGGHPWGCLAPWAQWARGRGPCPPRQPVFPGRFHSGPAACAPWDPRTPPGPAPAPRSSQPPWPPVVSSGGAAAQLCESRSTPGRTSHLCSARAGGPRPGPRFPTWRPRVGLLATALPTASPLPRPLFRTARVASICEQVSAFQMICFRVGPVSVQNSCKMKGFLSCGWTVKEVRSTGGNQECRQRRCHPAVPLSVPSVRTLCSPRESFHSPKGERLVNLGGCRAGDGPSW